MQDTMGIRKVKSVEFSNPTFPISIWPLITNSGYQEDELFPIGQMDHKDLGMFWYHNKKRQFFCKKNFFEILTSQKKSQLISAVCLHFFKKYKNSKMFMVQSQNYTTVWYNMLFVYIFVIYAIYVITQKCKQISCFMRQLSNSQIVP